MGMSSRCKRESRRHAEEVGFCSFNHVSTFRIFLHFAEDIIQKIWKLIFKFITFRFSISKLKYKF